MKNSSALQLLAVLFGGNGFAGRYVAEKRLQNGWNVRVVSRHLDVLFAIFEIALNFPRRVRR